jgi:hypothetical protein
LSSYQSEERRSFRSKLENLPKSLGQVPEIVLRSRKVFAEEQAILQKKLNPKAKEFVSRSPKIETVPKKQIKKVVHNPYAKIINQEQPVSLHDTKDQKPILSTFDPRGNPYAKVAVAAAPN